MSRTIRRKKAPFPHTRDEYENTWEHAWWNLGTTYEEGLRSFHSEMYGWGMISQDLKHEEKSKRRAAETRKIKAYRGVGWIEFEKVYGNVWNWD